MVEVCTIETSTGRDREKKNQENPILLFKKMHFAAWTKYLVNN